MRVLLTGTSGFVGLNLSLYLKEAKIELIPLSRLELNEGKFQKTTDVDAIVHLAGKAHDLRKSVDPEEYYYVNYELTKRLYLQFLDSRATKFIFISSVKASADSVLDQLYESDKPNPQTEYGKSKLMAEQFIQSQVLPKGKSYFILRPCMIHGPGNRGNLNLLYNVITKGIPYPLAAFENKRSFLSIENLCFVIKQLLVRNDVPSGLYQLSDDEALSTNELVKLIGKITGKPARLWRIPKKMIGSLAKIGDLLHLPLTSERLDKLTESYLVNNSKIKVALNSDLPVDSREGIRITITSFSMSKK